MASDVLTQPGSRPLGGAEDTTKSSAESSTDFLALNATAALTASGVAGRVALQHFPSVEPLVAVAAASGFYFGVRYGVLAGASGFLLSNFLVFGGQGPWTVLQAGGAALAGISGATAGKFSKSRYMFLLSAVVGCVFFEAFVNLGSLFYASFTGLGVVYLLGAIPFGLTHIISTAGFGAILYGAKEKIGKYRS